MKSPQANSNEAGKNNDRLNELEKQLAVARLEVQNQINQNTELSKLLQGALVTIGKFEEHEKAALNHEVTRLAVIKADLIDRQKLLEDIKKYEELKEFLNRQAVSINQWHQTYEDQALLVIVLQEAATCDCRIAKSTLETVFKKTFKDTIEITSQGYIFRKVFLSSEQYTYTGISLLKK
jgi:predicted transcriptional regulator